MRWFVCIGAFCFLSCKPDLHSEHSEFPIDKDWLLGRIDYAKDSRFVRIGQIHTQRKKIYLYRDAYRAFSNMHASAKKDGIKLVILSAARNFWYQRKIWELKWKSGGELSTAKKILKYSAMPATSRHHWGTDIDLNAFENAYFAKKEGLKIYQWLQKNAARFGFCQVYTKKNKKRPYGYEEESWHWSYLPAAKLLTRAYLKHIRYNDIKGFSGSALAGKIKIIEHYVDGIDPSCR